MHDKNIAALVEYFAFGCKKEQLLGVELEHFVIDKKTRFSLPYENGVEEILRRLQPLYGTPVYSQGRIIGIAHADSDISLEPAAQLEISIYPTPCIDKIKNTYDEFLAKISPILDEKNCELFYAGYHPKSKASELALIPKQRYEFMQNYFNSTGTHGEHMMKGTAAVQISIDYEDESDFSKKFRVANILCPLFSFICDNTKIFEGEPFRGRMARAHIWNNVDLCRSMLVQNACDGNFGFHDYAKYIYEMPPIFILQENEAVYTGNKPNSEIFTKRKLTQNDIEHITSMAFPDVRLKNLIEIRVADSMPIIETLAFTALIKGIFYNKTNLNKIFDETIKIKNKDVSEAKTSLIMYGADAKIYKKPVKFWLEKLLQMAQSGLNEKEKAFLSAEFFFVNLFSKKACI